MTWTMNQWYPSTERFFLWHKSEGNERRTIQFVQGISGPPVDSADKSGPVLIMQQMVK